MPIEFGYIPSGEWEECDSYLVEQDEGIFLTDHSTGETQVLAILCERDDSKGQVKVLNVKDVVGEETEDGVLIKNLPEPIATIDVDENRPHEQEFVGEPNRVEMELYLF
jgi:hypothetical protein